MNEKTGLTSLALLFLRPGAAKRSFAAIALHPMFSMLSFFMLVS